MLNKEKRKGRSRKTFAKVYIRSEDFFNVNRYLHLSMTFVRI